MKKTVLSLLLLGLIAGCSSVQQKPAPVVNSGMSQAERDAAAAKAAADKAAAEARALAEQRALAEKANPLNDPNSPLAQRSVYFAFDSSLVEDSYRPMLQAHAGYLSGHQNTKITIQGNTDDRGSREYNLALGQRRADSVRKVLNVLGVSESQMEAVSFGAEKPKASGNDEAAWKENRRADIVYGQ
jgi:peptidoglycan-associated lipoprotein